MAQFGHPELGGTGQWMRGGMTMVGDMFNASLQARVAALCEDMARLYLDHPDWQEVEARSGAGSQWWPAGLGAPASSGNQNGFDYAYFPASRRLAIRRGGGVELYDTGHHLICGVSQQQGGMDFLSFASQSGPVSLDELRRVDAAPPDVDAARPSTTTTTTTTTPTPTSMISATHAPTPAPDLLATIEKLASLHAQGVLTDAEFHAKKTELLGRL